MKKEYSFDITIYESDLKNDRTGKIFGKIIKVRRPFGEFDEKANPPKFKIGDAIHCDKNEVFVQPGWRIATINESYIFEKLEPVTSEQERDPIHIPYKYGKNKIVVSSKKYDDNQGKILYIDRGAIVENGNIQSLRLDVGDEICFKIDSIDQLEVGEKTFAFIKDSDVLTRVKRKHNEY